MNNFKFHETFISKYNNKCTDLIRYNQAFNNPVNNPIDAIKQNIGLTLFGQAKILEDNNKSAKVELNGTYTFMIIGAEKIA